jgi:hypothetical protein
MPINGRDPVRTKIVTDNKIIEKVNLFNCLGNISYEKELDIDNKLQMYLKITDVLNNVFRPQKNLNHLKAELHPICHLLALRGAHHILHVSRIRVKKTRIKLHNTLAHRFCYMVVKRGLL